MVEGSGWRRQKDVTVRFVNCDFGSVSLGRELEGAGSYCSNASWKRARRAQRQEKGGEERGARMRVSLRLPGRGF